MTSLCLWSQTKQVGLALVAPTGLHRQTAAPCQIQGLMFLISSKTLFFFRFAFAFAKFTSWPGFSLCWKLRFVNVKLLCLFSSTFHENTLHKSRHFLSKHLTRKAWLWRNWRNGCSVLPRYQVCQEWTTRIQKQSIDLLYLAVKSIDQVYTFKVSDAWGKCEKISEIKNTSIFFLQDLATLSIKTIAT